MRVLLRALGRRQLCWRAHLELRRALRLIDARERALTEADALIAEAAALRARR